MTESLSLSGFLDRLRVKAKRDLEPFQRRDRFGELTGRAEGFALFILMILQRLQTQTGLLRFGCTVKTNVSVDREAGHPTIIVSHEVTAIEEGLIRDKCDINALYAQAFPFNAVMDGSFAVSRSEPLVQRYFNACRAGNSEERCGVLAMLCSQAADAFTIADLQVVPPPSEPDSSPFITEPAT